MVLLLAGLATMQAMAWENHSLASYRAFENMPEVASAPSVTVEPLEAFLRAEEYTLEALLASQEAWGLTSIEKYPARPAELAFKADPGRSDESRRLAFLRALRVAPDSRFALYTQSDPWNPTSGTRLPSAAVSTQTEATGSGYRYGALKSGELVAALTVLATATGEPDLGLDIHLFEDSPSDWGRVYGFGPQPYGNPAVAQDSHIPFHSGFMHESRLVKLGIPTVRRNLILLRFHQFSTLAALAFRTGHAYWGWRFAGLSLHYLQDLTQPLRAALVPGEPNTKLLSAQALALVGLPGMKDELVQLRSNRCLVVEKYQSELLLRAAANKQETALEKALRNTDKDRGYTDWSERYMRDVVSLQSSRAALALAQTLTAALPAAFAADAGFDLAARETGSNLLSELIKRDSPERNRLDAALAETMANFGTHSRNALRGILRASDPL
ncbi:phospholipase [Rhodoferax lacus]|uniref:Phospholipase n=1 Tax=Rhodoferax lacus TaxID=2184758 RepID=A0A3E1RHB6_9BURK|nr:phospholipase [Rhodoferax lacus]